MPVSEIRAEDVKALRTYSALVIAGGVVILLFGVVRWMGDPGTQDPFWERCLVSALCFAFAALTRVDGPVRRWPHRSMEILIYIVSASIIHMTSVNGFSVNGNYGLLVMLFGCSLACRTRLSLGLYLFSACVAIGILMSRAAPLEIDVTYFLWTLVATSILTFVVQMNRIATEADMRSARVLAEEAVEARGQFLANMSHEIRTPMNGVIGMTSLLEDTRLDATQQDYLRTIKVSGKALLSIVNDILDFSKIEAGRVELDREPFHLVRCIEDALDVVAGAAREKGVELVCDCDPALPQVVVGDGLRLRQVLVNLLGNAVKFTQDGEIHLAVSAVPVEDGSLRLNCAVTDTGVGIEGNRIDCLFEAFTQADTSTTRRFGGTGLGLSICKLLVELMGGHISVFSVPGRGSTFRFDVILGQHGRPRAVPGSRPYSSFRVLVMEPNPRTRAALQRHLASWNLQSDAAASEEEALAQLGDGRYDLVVAGTSVEGCRRLAAALSSAETGNVPRLVRIAPMRESPGEGREDKAFATLYRPVRRAQLQRAVLRTFGGVHDLPGLDLPAAEATARESDPGAALRVLVVEDNLVNQKVTVKMLERLGHTVGVAGNGREALEVLGRHSYDLVFMDLQMPEMDGLEATRQIRTRWPDASLRIVAMTANAMQGDREMCLEAGMDDYLAKPVRIDDVQKLVDAARARASRAGGEEHQQRHVFLDLEK